ncbi:unnamed protein product, partial [Ixodes hexagonus]
VITKIGFGFSSAYLTEKIRPMEPEGPKVLNARMMGKSDATLITFQGTRVPRFVRLGMVECRCRPYFPKEQVCDICLELWHRETCALTLKRTSAPHAASSMETWSSTSAHPTACTARDNIRPTIQNARRGSVSRTIRAVYTCATKGETAKATETEQGAQGPAKSEQYHCQAAATATVAATSTAREDRAASLAGAERRRVRYMANPYAPLASAGPENYAAALTRAPGWNPGYQHFYHEAMA